MQLDKTSTKILIFIRDNSPASTEDISALISNKTLAESCILSLIRKNYIKGLIPYTYHTPNGVRSTYSSPYTITADGIAYLEISKKENRKEKLKIFHDWVNTIIALLALLTAIPALILSVKQLLK